MRYLIAIDPGATTGVAIFAAGLAACDTDSRLRGVRLIKGSHGINTLEIPRLLYAFPRSDVVCEVPQSYSGSIVSKQSLLKLSFRAGYLVGQLRPREVTAVKPREWKGQAPKAVDHNRTRRILTIEELDVLIAEMGRYRKSEQHNIMDAVGIGLWKLGRRL